MNDHDCVKLDTIEDLKKDVEHLSHRVNGYEDETGIYADIKMIIRNQQNNKSWFKGSLFTFGTFIIMLFYFGVSDHNKIQDMPMYLQDNFIDKRDFDKSMAVITELNNVLFRNGIKADKDIEAIKKEVDRLYENYAYFKTTRGGYFENKPVRPRIDYDSIKQIELEKRYNQLKNEKNEKN